MHELTVLELVTDHGVCRAALGPRGVIALALPGRDYEHFRSLAKRRAPGASLRTGEPADHQAGRQLMAYFAGEPEALDGAVDLDGLTEFTRAVLTAARAVPYGRTTTYGALAAAVGRPRAARAVGQVMHHNPVPLFVPCHRVLGAGGGLTGFGGGLDLKRALLDLEARGLAA